MACWPTFFPAPDDEDDATVVLGRYLRRMARRRSPQGIWRRGCPPWCWAAICWARWNLCTARCAAEAEGDFRGKLLPCSRSWSMPCWTTVFRSVTANALSACMAGDNFTIGRESSFAGADVAIPCRWLSRGAKNLRLQMQDGQWHASDLGSTNGHFLDGKRLQANVPVPLPRGRDLAGSRQDGIRSRAGLAASARQSGKCGGTELRHRG